MCVRECGLAALSQLAEDWMNNIILYNIIIMYHIIVYVIYASQLYDIIANKGRKNMNLTRWYSDLVTII